MRPQTAEPPQPWSRLTLPLATAALAWALEGGWLAPLTRGQGLWWDARISATLSWLATTWLLLRALDLLVWQRVLPQATGLRLPRLLRQFVAVLVWMVVGAALLGQVWGVALAAVLATTGVLGLVLGMALRNTLQDFFSGIALNVEQPFSLDDFVALHVGSRGPIVGVVREMSWRSTRILTPEENLVIVPNSRVAEATVENLSFPSPVSEHELDIVLDWSIDPARLAALLEAAMMEAWVRGATSGEAPPRHRIIRLDAAGVTYRLIYLIDPRRKPKGPARHILLAAVQRHLRFAGLRPVGAPGGATLEGFPPAQTPLDHGKAADRAYAIGQVALFAALHDDERARLIEAVTVRHAARGELVVRAGEQGESMFIVVAGVLEVRLPLGDAGGPAPSGQPASAERRVNTLGPGDAFGEMSLLTGAPRSASVGALTAAVLYEVPKSALATLLQARRSLADALSEVVSAHQQRDAEQAAAPPAVEARLSAREQLARRIRDFFRA